MYRCLPRHVCTCMNMSDKPFSGGANGRVLTQVEQEVTEDVRNATCHKETLI